MSKSSAQPRSTALPRSGAADTPSVSVGAGQVENVGEGQGTGAQVNLAEQQASRSEAVEKPPVVAAQPPVQNDPERHAAGVQAELHVRQSLLSKEYETGTYLVGDCPVDHDGERYGTGAEIELTEYQANRLGRLVTKAPSLNHYLQFMTANAVERKD